MIPTFIKALGALCLSALLFLSSSSAQVRSKCVATFKSSDLIWNGEPLGAWIRGDVSHSVAREDGSTLWFFGNTVVNSPHNSKPEGGVTISNSVGISECNEQTGEFTIRYDWGISDRMRYEPIFKPKDLPPKYSYKPDVPWFYHGILFVPLKLIERTFITQEERVVGLHLARVLNPERDPSEWRISYGALLDSKELHHEQTIVSNEAYVYFISGISEGKIVSRVKKSETMGALTSLAERVEYLIGNGNWKREFLHQGMGIQSSLFLIKDISEGTFLK